MNLSETFYDLLEKYGENPEIGAKIAQLVLSADETPESDGMLAYIYHEGIGVEADLDKCFELAEKASDGGDGLGYFLLGFMCDNAETPDQAEGGPRQKYDHYDAERFYEKCAETDSPWASMAHLWLGNYFMDSAQGGDPEIAIEHYEAIADTDADAAGAICDYYWGFYEVSPDDDDEELYKKVYLWTNKAYDLDPEGYAYQLGCVYEDGIGCKRSLQKAKEYFEEAYAYGDYLAVDALVDVCEEWLDEPGLSDAERKKCEEELAKWMKVAEDITDNGIDDDEEDE